jgi:TRAP-type mannitol/chloroaromatic compound transport system permease large subunit
MELTILALSFTLLLVLGVPVAFAIGLSSVATILAAGLPVAVVFQKMVGGMQVFSFLAIPFFVFAGELMLYGGIADRIVKFANSLVIRRDFYSLPIWQLWPQCLVLYQLASL